MIPIPPTVTPCTPPVAATVRWRLSLTNEDTGLVAWRAWYEPYGKMHEDCG